MWSWLRPPGALEVWTTFQKKNLIKNINIFFFKINSYLFSLSSVVSLVRPFPGKCWNYDLSCTLHDFFFTLHVVLFTIDRLQFRTAYTEIFSVIYRPRLCLTTKYLFVWTLNENPNPIRVSGLYFHYKFIFISPLLFKYLKIRLQCRPNTTYVIHG